MRKVVPSTLLCVICFLSVAIVARGQSIPAETGSPVYTGFSIPTVNGTLHYAVNAGVREIFGNMNQESAITDGTVSVNLGFITPSIRMPTSVTYTGGYLATTGAYPSSFFHDFAISQDYNTRKLKITASDQLRYLPDSPFSGISGVVGTGTTTGTVTSQSPLIPFVTRIDNSADGLATYELTGKTAIDGSGDYMIQRYPGYVGGIQTNTYAIHGGVTHRIDARVTVGVSYLYSNFSYIDVAGTFSSQGATLLYKRQWTRRLLISLAGGPQYISASTLTNRPASLNYNADTSATYIGSLEHGVTMTVAYKRSTNGGNGLTFGATTDTFTGNVTTRLTRSFVVSAVATYARSSGLQLITANQVNSQQAIGNIQANRALTRTFSLFVSYTVSHQEVQGLYSGSTPQIGLQQVLGFGATYSPSPVHLGRQ